ncbi:Pyridoxamine 5'-phosphate oxidase-related protein [Actinobacteria bacterium OK074]|nr:Pyridoxamine 5'-phosphate oxidase-related protein [Actinobacteria bacterium OK074]
MPTDAQRAVDLLDLVPHGRIATSRHALPLLATARHVVVNGRVLLRLHRGYGYHQACAGSVVAYGAEGPREAPETPETPERWSVQVVGVCETVEPSSSELALFGPAPRHADGAPFEPVYLRLTPSFATVHITDDHTG